MNGSCHCQSVRFTFEFSEALGDITICHCADCRKLQGGAVTAVPVRSASVRWLAGKELVTEYASSAQKKRGFCSRCGTPLYSRRDDKPEVLRLRMGTIDSPLPAKPAAHIFAADLPGWAALDDSLPRYPRQEPGRLAQAGSNDKT